MRARACSSVRLSVCVRHPKGHTIDHTTETGHMWSLRNACVRVSHSKSNIRTSGHFSRIQLVEFFFKEKFVSFLLCTCTCFKHVMSSPRCYIEVPHIRNMLETHCQVLIELQRLNIYILLLLLVVSVQCSHTLTRMNLASQTWKMNGTARMRFSNVS